MFDYQAFLWVYEFENCFSVSLTTKCTVALRANIMWSRFEYVLYMNYYLKVLFMLLKLILCPIPTKRKGCLPSDFLSHIALLQQLV